MAFTNGDFETGDLTGWTDESSGDGTHAESVTVTTGAKISGTYGARFQASADNGGGSVSIAQIKTYFTYDNFKSLSFDYNPASIVSQTGAPIHLIVYSNDSSWSFITIYDNVLDGESPGVVHVDIDLSTFDFGTNAQLTFLVQIGG